jgi:sugar O-acyltransferase (sialic acid O-acetyltransferase NeuD family)
VLNALGEIRKTMTVTINKTNNSQSKVIVGLVGSGGFAREVMPVLNEHLSILANSDLDTFYELYFVETNPTSKEVNNYSLISEEDFFEIECSERWFNIAIGDSHIREKIADEFIIKGARPTAIKSSNAIVYDGNELGDGIVLCALTMVTSNAKIGKFFHSNIYSYVAHDCLIGDYVTFAPNVHCNGNVHIHNHAYIGTGAVIKQGTPDKPLVIGEGSIVGMGAVVTKDVAPYSIVVGSPAKPLEKK